MPRDEYTTPPGGPRARHSDSWTSKEAAAAIEKHLGRLQQLTLELIQANPGSTYAELRRLADALVFKDPSWRNRKLRTGELKDLNLVHVAGYKRDPYSGKNGLRWWPGPDSSLNHPAPPSRQRRRKKHTPPSTAQLGLFEGDK